MRRGSKSRAGKGGKTAPVLIAAAVAILLTSGIWLLTRDESSSEPTEAAPDITLTFFDGTTQALSDFQGKPVVLNFWASWCPACVAEMPAFADVHRELGGQVEFIGLNMQEVDLEAAIDLVEQTTVEYRLAHDPNGTIFTRFGGIAMPTTVFVDADGSVARVHSGTISANELTSIIETELLG